MPGYTHLQRAQPVTLGHHLLAWVEMLERDLRPVLGARRAGGAVAARGGRAGRVDARAAATPTGLRNSLDAVSDRDFALDYLYACAALFVHLSRIGEELVLWSTAEFGFVRLPESAATGSSMMPQKLNPDVAELARGEGRDGDRSPDRPARHRQGAAARVQPRSPGGQAARVRRASRPRGVLAALAVLVRDLVVRARERLAEAAADPLLAPPTPPSSWSPRACPSATRTSRWRQTCVKGRSCRPPVPGRRSRRGLRPCVTPSRQRNDACSRQVRSPHGRAVAPRAGTHPAACSTATARRSESRRLHGRRTGAERRRRSLSLLQPLVPTVRALSDRVLPGVRLVRTSAPSVPLPRREPRSRRGRRAPGRPGAIDQGSLSAAGQEVASRRHRSRQPAGRRDDGRQEPRASPTGPSTSWSAHTCSTSSRSTTWPSQSSTASHAPAARFSSRLRGAPSRGCPTSTRSGSRRSASGSSRSCSRSRRARGTPALRAPLG